jgi:ribosomal protein S18 acetylase RimI-like enzyme
VSDVIAYRTATEAEVPAIVTLVQSAYRGDASRAGWTTEADFLDGQRIDADGVREIIGKPDSRIVLAERPSTGSGRTGELLGSVQVEQIDGHGYFGMFSVRPDLQGHGIGDALLSEAERVVRDEFGCTTMTCSVISIRAELIGWYRRRGYRSTGEFKPFPYGDARFGLPKRDDLRFEVFAKELA